MEKLVQIPVSLWHFPFGLCAAALFGAICHVLRAVLNVFPDRFSDSRILDMALSGNYSFWDWYYGTEYNEAGYYELYSSKNLRLAVIYSLISFAIFWFCIPVFAHMVAFAGNFLAASFAQAFMSSIEHYTQS